MQHLVDGQSQDVPIHLGDALDVPVACLLSDDAVEFDEFFQDTADERFTEPPNFGVLGRWWRRFWRFAPSGRLVILGDGGAGLGFPKAVELLLDCHGRVHIMLKQELYGPFAGQAAITHRRDSE